LGAALAGCSQIYADTHGTTTISRARTRGRIRDYVVHAFNDDKPYARFVQEAGGRRRAFPRTIRRPRWRSVSRGGTVDHTLMVTVREDTVDHHMAQNLDRDNMVSTADGHVSKPHCPLRALPQPQVRPITQREYYSLQASSPGGPREPALRCG